MWTLLALADFFQCCLAVPVVPDWKNEIWGEIIIKKLLDEGAKRNTVRIVCRN